MPAVMRKRPVLSGEDAKRFIHLEKRNDATLKRKVEKLIKKKENNN